MTDEERARRNAIHNVMVVLRNRMMHFSPEFQAAFDAAAKLDIKAIEVLEYSRDYTRKTS
jgi:hypothetical protein